MTTTQVFIELLITGFGGLIWILLLAFGLSGIEINFLFEKELSNVLLLPISGVAYIIGILIDRVGFQIFIKRERKNITKVFENKEEQDMIHAMIVFITENSKRLSGKIDYNRSRLRLCRSWTLNFFLIFLSLIPFLFLKWGQPMFLFLIVVQAIVLLLFFLSGFIWQKLSIDYYINIKGSFKNLKQLMHHPD